jgi:bacterial/archaeal transporter family-2 protein
VGSAAGAVLMALVGAQLSQQAPVNRGLARASGPVPAAFVNFAVGTALLLVACAAAGELGGLGRIGPDWWHALGGCLGAIYVLTALAVVRSIGASGIAAGTITGQLVSSVAIDAGGLLGVEQRPLGVSVALGAAAVLLGTYLVAGVPRQRADGGMAAWRGLLPLAAIAAAGALVGIQIPLNGLLAESTGDFASGLLNFLVGGAALAVVLLATRPSPGLAAVGRVRWYYLAGGAFGAVNALAGLALVGEIGAGTVAAATITGQMLASLAIDRAGLFGLEPRPISGRRLAGALLLVAGTVLVAS